MMMMMSLLMMKIKIVTMRKYLVNLCFENGLCHYLVMTAEDYESCFIKCSELIPTTQWRIRYFIIEGELISFTSIRMFEPPFDKEKYLSLIKKDKENQ